MGHKSRGNGTLGPTSRALLEELSPAGAGIAARDLAKAVGKTTGAVNQSLRQLRTAGLTKTVGNGTGRGSALLWIRSFSAPWGRAKFEPPKPGPLHIGVFAGGPPQVQTRTTPSNGIERSTEEVRRRHRIAKFAQEARELNIHELRYEAGTDRFHITYRTTEIFKGPQTP